MNNRIFKSPYPLLDRRCYCCDSHHMKPLVADIWFLSTVKTHRGTGGTVGKHPSTCRRADGWNETLAICI